VLRRPSEPAAKTKFERLLWSHGATNAAYPLLCYGITSRRNGLRDSLLRWYGIEFPRPFLVKEGAFRLVTAAPMLVAAQDS
jgi:hypothetical protein